MAEEEFDDVRAMLHVCRGFEGGLRKAVSVGGDSVYRSGDPIVFVVQAVVGPITFVPHEDEDEDEDGEGFDRLHTSRLAVVTVVDRETVAAALDAQSLRNNDAEERKAKAKEARKELKRAERKAAKDLAQAGVPTPLPFAGKGAPEEPDLPEDVTPAERAAMRVVG